MMIRTKLRASLFLLSLLVVSVTTLGAAEAWTEDFEAAKQKAVETKKDLLIAFSGSDWCVWCQKLDQEVFQQEDFTSKATQNFVLVHLDFPRKTEQEPKIKAQNEALAKLFKEKHGFEGRFPTVYLADAAGVPYAKTGYREGGPEAYLEHLAFLKKAQPLVDLGATWLEDYEVAKAKAEALGKDLLINFSGSDWCIWCVRLDKDVFEKELFKKEAPKDYVLLKLDFPRRKSQPAWLKAQNQMLSKQYQFQNRYPTVFLADGTGVPYGQTSYMPSPEEFLKELKELQKKKPKN